MAENKRTVLVMEDSSNDAALICVAFERAGLDQRFQTQTVHNVQEGRRYLMGEGQYADRTKFPKANLLLLDHQMPGDGMGILQWARAQPALAALPIVVFSGSDDPRHRQSSLDAGANAYYRKPLNFDGFVASVKNIIETWLPG
jgi:DNA-binding response OmpR family regulator